MATRSRKKQDSNQVDITVVDFPECVRLRKEMYLSGPNHAADEIIDNAVDEFLAGYCTQINVTVFEDQSIEVSDNGRGMKVDKHPDPRYSHLTEAEVAYCVLHAGGKFGKGNSYKSATGGLHGVGASSTNATSEHLELKIYKNKKVYKSVFEKGILIKPMEHLKTLRHEKTGTSVTFKLDSEIWKDEAFDYGALKATLKQRAYLNSGLEIIYENELTKEAETFYFEEGIKSYVETLSEKKKPLFEPIYGKTEVDDLQIQVAFTYTATYSSTVKSFCNNILTSDGGDHLIGFNHGLLKAINRFAYEKKLIGEDEKFETNDCLEGLVGVITLMAKEVKFDGQSKSRIRMPYVKKPVRDFVEEVFFSYLDNNPKIVKIILEKVTLSRDARLSAAKAREQIRKSKTLSAGIAKSLTTCSDKNPEHCEIYIVEGESAGGTAKSARNRQTQAILPIFGKVLNSIKGGIEKVIENTKIADLIVSLKCGIGEDFDIEKLRYHKIIIMSDADVDGLHIQTLFLALFYAFYRPIVEKGYLYMAMPPLYKLEVKSKRKKETIYAYTDDEKDSLVKQYPNAEVQRYKGLGEMKPKQLWDTTMNPETRSLIQITLEDAERAAEIIDICFGNDVAKRREFIENNAS